MDIRVRMILEQIKGLSAQVFDENLVGVYVHGSLALGCFCWDHSDIDFILVLKDAPAPAQKEEYLSGLLEINRISPPKGLEMSAVLEKYTRRFVYPTPFELHFSKAHLAWCTENLHDYCLNMNGTDKDLAAHFTIISNSCITVCGKPAKDVFGAVPPADYWDSILYDIENAEDEIVENSMYIILNLCRVLAYKRDHLILSKKDGGNWGIAHLDRQYAGLIENALKAYQGTSSPESGTDDRRLVDFAKYMGCLIFSDRAQADDPRSF